MRIIRHLILLASFSASLYAQSPGWSRGQQQLPMSFEECVRRASTALTNRGFAIDTSSGAFVVGRREVHTAVIMCNAASEGRQWVNIVVASNGEGGGSHRELLQAEMERPGSTGDRGNGGGGGSSQAGRYLHVATLGNRATVKWSNAPTGEGSWISVVSAGTPDDQHLGRWVYTERKSSGTFESTLTPGSYEARFYGDGGYSTILDRVRFEVAADLPQAGRILAVRVDRGHAFVSWSNAPTGDPYAWVGVVPSGTADTTHVGKWVYTEGKASGVYDSGPLTPGRYEARFYGDGQYGLLLDRIAFTVN